MPKIEKAYKVVRSDRLSRGYSSRYVVVDTETGKILDDAYGYGYKSAQKAHAAYAYKHRDPAKAKERQKKDDEIRKWLKEHKNFDLAMDQYALEVLKGSWVPEPDEKINAAFVRKMLAGCGYEDLPFTAGELLRVWQKS